MLFVVKNYVHNKTEFAENFIKEKLMRNLNEESSVLYFTIRLIRFNVSL